MPDDSGRTEEAWQELLHSAVEFLAAHSVGTEVAVRVELLCPSEGPFGIFEPAPEDEYDPSGVVCRGFTGL